MTTLALALVVAILLARVPLLMLDRPIGLRDSIITWGIQLVAVLLLVQGFTAGFWAGACLVGVHAAIHLVWWRLEQRREADLQLLRMGSSLMLLLLATVLASPWTGSAARDFRPWLQPLARGFAPLDFLSQLSWRGFLAKAVALLLCLNEANALIRWIIERMNLKPRETAQDSSAGVDTRRIVTPEDASVEYRRGRLIGVLERGIIFVLVLHGQYTALAFVLAAKSMARFKSLDDRNFAEYFLLGTLLSVLLAGALALAVA